MTGGLGGQIESSGGLGREQARTGESLLLLRTGASQYEFGDWAIDELCEVRVLGDWKGDVNWAGTWGDGIR